MEGERRQTLQPELEASVPAFQAHAVILVPNKMAKSTENLFEHFSPGKAFQGREEVRLRQPKLST